MKPLFPIERITFYFGEMPVNLRFSYGEVKKFPFAFIEIESGEFRGIGESAGRFKRLFKAGKELIGKDAIQLEGLLPDYLLQQEFNEEREGLSIALYDLVGKIYGLPVHTLLGGKRRERVPLMPVVFPKNPKDAGEKAKKFVKSGYRYLKVKFMGNLEEDLYILREIRKKAGKEIYLQADVNCGYKKIEEAREALLRFEEGELDVVEDLMEGSLDEYASLRGLTEVKIMLDKHARSLGKVGEIVKKESADIINQHPGQQGGLMRAIMVNAASSAGGIPTFIGGTGFMGVGTAAFQSLASVIGLKFPCGELCGFVDHGFPDFLVEKLYSVKSGEAIIPDTPGLGVKLASIKLRKYVKKVVTLP